MAVDRGGLRVAHFLPNLAVGGRERIVNELCRASGALGMSPIIVGYEPLPTHVAQLAPQAPYHSLDRTRPSFAADLRRLVRDEGIDLIHAQGHIPACHLRSAGTGVPSIATMHVGLQGTRRWAWAIRRALRAVDAVTAVSADLARTYARLSGCSVHPLANGIDRSVFGSAAMPQAGAPFRFAMLSRLDPVKRHADAVRAGDILAGQGYAFELHVAGKGERFAMLAQAASSRPWLRLAGVAGNSAAFLQDKHGFLLPSVAEGAPLALIEAMTTGLPCIVSDLPSLRAIAGDTAAYVPPRSPRALAAAMARVLQDRQAWEANAARVRERSVLFDIEPAAQSYARLYASVLSGRRRERPRPFAGLTAGATWT